MSWGWLGVVLAGLGGAACGPYDTGLRSQAGVVLRMGMAEPAAIDPYTAYESNGVLVTGLLFDGLLTLDETTRELRPGVAQAWSGNDDCTQWSFSLRSDVTFSTGERVTAQSFIRGMTRVVDGRAASDVAYHMAGIAGYDELHGTEDEPDPATDTFAGLAAPDPETLVVTLAQADCEFDKKVLHPAFSPVPSAAATPANEDDDFNNQPVGNGPFKLAGPWRHDRGITLVRNDAYVGPRPALDGIEIAILPAEGSEDAAYRSFRVGRFDMAYVPAALVPQARATYGPQGGFGSPGTSNTVFILPRADKPPFDNAWARRAVSLAIDRRAIMAGVFGGTRQAADSLVPPTMADAYQPGVCDACVFDPVGARAAARAGGLERGMKVPLTYESGGIDDAAVQALAAQLKRTLGLRIDLRPMPTNEFYDTESSDDGEGLFLDGWSADYPTPDNFLYPLLSSESADNYSRYVNPELDELIAKGRAARDGASRLAFQREAEALAIGSDVALIPFRYGNGYLAFDSQRFSGITLDFFGNPTLVTTELRPRPAAPTKS